MLLASLLVFTTMVLNHQLNTSVGYVLCLYSLEYVRWLRIFGMKPKGESRCSVLVVVQSLSSVWLFCDPMECSMPGFPVFYYHPKFAQTHVHWVDDAIQLSHPLSIPSLPAFCPFPASGSLLMSQLFPSGGQSIGASVSALVLPVNIQGWLPLGLTGLISFQSKGLSEVFSNTTVWKYWFLALSLIYGPTLHICTCY